MGAVTRLTGAISFILLFLDLFLPWFNLSAKVVPAFLREGFRPIDVLSKSYNNLDPIGLFFLIPLVVVFIGAVYCVVRPSTGGRIALAALVFMIALIFLVYYNEHQEVLDLISTVIGSLREGFVVALVSSLAASLTGLSFEKGVKVPGRSASFKVYTGEE